VARKPNKDDKSPRIREIEANARIRAKRIDAIGGFANKALKYGCIAFCVWSFSGAIRSLSGQRTLADMKLSMLGSFTIERTLCLGAAAGGIVYGHKQRRLRQQKTARLEGRIHELEQAIDPGRSSSRLTPEGKTNPKDEDDV
jgi:hypothetical protein